jgi:transposase InsO family protein
MFAKNPEAPEDLEVRASGSMSSADRSVAVPSMLPPPLETNANSSSRNSADALMERRNPSELESQPEVPKPADETPTKHQDSRFKALPKWEQQEITNMHKNLGHPSNDRLSKALQVAGYRVEVVQAALELKCHICAACSPPKHQRPGTLKPLLDFNHKVYIDGVNWKNSKGKSFHWYHFLDAGSNYHVAVCAPSRDTQDFARLIDHHWISWAGPPNMIQVDSATEMNSHDLTSFMQRYGIKQLTIPPEAHWQQGKIERHGGFLQSMLTKLDLEHAIDDYTQLQTALNQCTHAKNSLSIRHGYAPEVIVFGKHSRLARSILSDESRPSHELALREDQDIGVQEFKSLLQIRESARRAFHSVDNSNALRRAVLRRPCPPRGMYEPNQWVMIWRAEQQGNPKWIGPQKIIIQDGNHTVWSTQGGKLFRSAPEHVRLALPEEGTDESSELPEDHTMLHRQIERINQESHNQLPTIPEMHELDFPPSNPSQALQVPTQPESETSGVSRTNSESIPQPDHEPESSRQVTPMPPLAISEEHLQENDQLICEDVDWVFQTDAVDIDAAWRCEFDVSLQSHEALPQNQAEAWTLLATSAKKQRTEVKLSELSPAEKAEFDRAKEAEVQNWIQTGTLSKVLRNQIPDDQILRCRWILTCKPLDPVGETQDNPNVSQKSLCQSQRTHKAKARLVVLGYLDPKIEEIPRDSPTLHRTSRMLLLQTIASNGWSLESFDIRAAFLQGTPQSDRVIGIEPVSEIRKAMNMSPWEVGKLNKGAYGLIDAPYLWYCALVTELQKLGFVATPFDPCLFVLRMPAGESNAGALAGVLGVHVDDGIGGGNEFYQEKIKLLEKKFPFGSHKTQAFTFTGIEVNQRGDNSIHLSQSSYVRKIKPIAIDINRKSQTNSAQSQKTRNLPSEDSSEVYNMHPQTLAQTLPVNFHFYSQP